MHAGKIEGERERVRDTERGMPEALAFSLLRQAANLREPQRLKLNLKVCVHV
jgi:hypothetical protein